ncbi:MAG: hypothetical protein KKH85_06490 [Proteobacteria bacterium]|nr:hypothetical protein [Pseudomonadota bacterium]
MKNLSIFIVTLMVIVFLAAVESQAGRVEKRYSRQQDRIENGERMRLERRQYPASRHIYRYKNNRIERRDRYHYDYDHISFKRSTVLVPLILPPSPPLPLVFPGVHILFNSSR